MNTVKSVGYGWGVLIVAGAGSYYFAKRSINADREQRAADEEKRRQQRERLRASEALSRQTALTAANAAGGETGKAALSEDTPIPSSKYEAAEPWRSRKGDRFS